MAQDIRKLLKDNPEKKPSLSKGHQARFEAKLDAALPQQKPTFLWIKFAAVAIVILTVSFFGYQYMSSFNGETIPNTNPIVEVEPKKEEKPNQISLGDLSPDLKKVETYYTAGINMQLASLKIDATNKEIVDGYMNQLSVLDKEYKRLNVDLNKEGPTEATITALIDNLKLRLELLFKLKNKLNEFKTQENETINNI